MGRAAKAHAWYVAEDKSRHSHRYQHKRFCAAVFVVVVVDGTFLGGLL